MFLWTFFFRGEKRKTTVVENTAQMNRMGQMQKKTTTEASARSFEKRLSAEWHESCINPPISCDLIIPNRTRQGSINNTRSKDSATQKSKKQQKQTSRPVFSGLESLWWSQWAVKATKPRPLKTYADLLSISIWKKRLWMIAFKQVALKQKKNAPMSLTSKRIGPMGPTQVRVPVGKLRRYCCCVQSVSITFLGFRFQEWKGVLTERQINRD